MKRAGRRPLLRPGDDVRPPQRRAAIATRRAPRLVKPLLLSFLISSPLLPSLPSLSRRHASSCRRCRRRRRAGCRCHQAPACTQTVRRTEKHDARNKYAPA